MWFYALQFHMQALFNKEEGGQYALETSCIHLFLLFWSVFCQCLLSHLHQVEIANWLLSTSNQLKQETKGIRQISTTQW